MRTYNLIFSTIFNFCILKLCLYSISRTEPNNYTPNIPRNPFPSYGMPDLDPLGGLHNPGGGMIFDPMRVRNDRSMGFPGYGVF